MGNGRDDEDKVRMNEDEDEGEKRKKGEKREREREWLQSYSAYSILYLYGKVDSVWLRSGYGKQRH